MWVKRQTFEIFNYQLRVNCQAGARWRPWRNLAYSGCEMVSACNHSSRSHHACLFYVRKFANASDTIYLERYVFFFLKGKRNQEAGVDSKANRKNELWGQWLEIRHFSSKRTCYSEVSRIALRGPAGVQSKATSTRTCSVLCLEAAFLTPSLSNIKTAFSSSRIPAKH